MNTRVLCAVAGTAGATIVLGQLHVGASGLGEKGAEELAENAAIVQEAGGLIEPLNPGSDILEDGEVICANEAMFEPFTKIIRGA